MNTPLPLFAAAGALALVAAPASAGAQDPPRLGAHVRVTVLTGPPAISGRLLAADSTSLGLRLDVAAGDTLARRIPRAAIAVLELDRTHGRSGTGALLGLGIGLFGGILIGNSKKDDGEWGGVGWYFGGPVYGTIGGAILGSFVRSERWETRPLPPAQD